MHYINLFFCATNMKVLGYVSDEMYVAIPDVLVEFESADGTVTVCGLRREEHSTAIWPLGPTASLYANRASGRRSSDTNLGSEPYQFRLLSDGLLGYMWPKWVRSGERAEFRVHSVEQYQLSLWRYGLQKECIGVIGWYDEHGPNATVQITPDGDLHPDRRAVEQTGYGSPDHTRFVTAPERGGLYYLWAKTPSGQGIFLSVGGGAGRSAGRRSQCSPARIPGTRTTTSAAAAITSMPTTCRTNQS